VTKVLQDLQASRADPRLSYCLHVPAAVQTNPRATKLVVVVHGSERKATAYRDAMVDFSEAHNCIILAPLFPVGPFGDGFGDGYKYLVEHDLRYDLAMLAMVEEVEHDLGFRFGKFGLFGFSGGGHFVHRFFYLHAERLWAVSIGAPGAVTLVDPSTGWWLGTGNTRALFGREPDVAAMRAVPVQLVIGGDDTRTLHHDPTSPNYRPEAARLGDNRMARMDALKDNLEKLGVSIEHAVVPGVGHNGLALVGEVQRFFGQFVATASL
jgi:poly(3-hydroxybutyrate) depolymerase